MIKEILVKNLDGEALNLMDKYKNDKPMLILFFNNRCLGCVGRAIPLAYDFSQEYENLNVLSIHTDFGKEIATKEDIVNLFTTKELPIPIFFDNGQENYEKFACEGTPHWIMLDKNGEIFRSFYGSQENAQNRLFYALDELVGM